MSTVDRKRGTKKIYYPESDGKPIFLERAFFILIRLRPSGFRYL